MTVELHYAVVAQQRDRQHGYSGSPPSRWSVFCIGRETGKFVFRQPKPKQYPDPRFAKEQIVARFNSEADALAFIERCRNFWNATSERMKPLKDAADQSARALR